MVPSDIVLYVFFIGPIIMWLGTATCKNGTVSFWNVILSNLLIAAFVNLG